MTAPARRFTIVVTLLVCGISNLPAMVPQQPTPSIPLPEHPRPDFERLDWVNLNGYWKLRFDPEDTGRSGRWFEGTVAFPKKILVPFPWGSPLSEVDDEAEIGWYSRSIQVPESWNGRRIFLVIGACDWETTVWLDGNLVGNHRGGYTPFEFELTPQVIFGKDQRLILRVDDSPHPFKLEGKQGYGPARGIWQTPYLESRGTAPIRAIHFTPDIEGEKVGVRVYLLDPAPSSMQLRLAFETGGVDPVTRQIPRNSSELQFDVPIPGPRLWSLEDPFLYRVQASLQAEGMEEDRVNGYFGMRKIGVARLPGSGHPYVALNDEPIYLQMTLDQAYHPQGYYTFPSDEFVREEVLRARRIGLNGLRVHVKTAIPRKLYWADRLGVLVMADVPNSWGEPDGEMRREVETTLRGMIQRDYNHPSVFSWVLFNETWGLRTEREYAPQTQEWVASMYRLTQSLDTTRLVEDNSPNREDHVVTDINTWHAYLPGYAWKRKLEEVSDGTYPGSTWNFVVGRHQDEQPMFNSECGNVWGYEGSTGDVDWSWDYHIMVNEFRRHPKVCGWLYTEHHDVVNEWNGYYRYDRSEKLTGLAELAEGMTLRDLHSPLYVSPGNEPCQEVEIGSKVEIPLWVSFLTKDSSYGDSLRLRARLYAWDDLGRKRMVEETSDRVSFAAWWSGEIAPVRVTAPTEPSLALLSLQLEGPGGSVLNRNFTTFLVTGGDDPQEEIRFEEGKMLRLVRFAPDRFSSADWSLKQWTVLDGLKVNGAGSGYFEYRMAWPEALKAQEVETASFRVEASAKQLFGKDRPEAEQMQGNYMLGRGTRDPSRNPNAYPMTDTLRFPSAVRIRINGRTVGVFELEDDPADHRGILSWCSQKRDRRLREAGSYGYLLTATIPGTILAEAEKRGEIVIRLEVDEALPGGLALYGRSFGRYPVDPTLVFVLER